MKQYGVNELQEKKKDSLFKKFMAQFKDFSIIILIYCKFRVLPLLIFFLFLFFNIVFL